MSPHLSIIITNYNEESNLKNGSLDELLKQIAKYDFSWELLLVDDGSIDKTLSLLKTYTTKDKRIRLLENPHMGKAAGIITGALAAKGQLILFTDMDQSTPVSEFEKFIPKFKSGYGVVIGSRARREGAPMFRQILAFGMVILRTLVLRLPVRDSQCGFKAFTKEAAEKIFTILKEVHPPVVINYPATNPGFDLEILYLARKLNFKLAEVPVIWRYRESKRVTFGADAVNGLKELLLVRWRSLTKAYKI